MSVKLPFTDEFLWLLYDLIETGDEVFDALFLSIPRSLRENVKLGKLVREYERRKMRRTFSQFIYYLKKNGYIKIRNLEKKKAIMLTQKGLEKALMAKFENEKKKRRKDGKWLMVMFDIPEKKRRLRSLFREYLQAMGFKMLQRSIWVCPFNVSEKLDKIIERYSIDPYIKMFLIEDL